jgi:hypothetical protein
MKSDEIGMITNQVKKISDKLDVFVTEGNKIESFFNSLCESAKGVYSSINSLTLNSNNSMIVEGIHVNTRNIKSYNFYVKKKMMGYSKAKNEAIDIISKVNSSIK